MIIIFYLFIDFHIKTYFSSFVLLTFDFETFSTELFDDGVIDWQTEVRLFNVSLLKLVFCLEHFKQVLHLVWTHSLSCVWDVYFGKILILRFIINIFRSVEFDGALIGVLQGVPQQLLNYYPQSVLVTDHWKVVFFYNLNQQLGSFKN